MNTDEHYIPWLVHDLMMIVNELKHAEQERYDFAPSDRTDIGLASAELGRLVERMTPRLEAAE